MLIFYPVFQLEMIPFGFVLSDFVMNMAQAQSFDLDAQSFC